MRGMKGLLPSPLPPISTTGSGSVQGFSSVMNDYDLDSQFNRSLMPLSLNGGSSQDTVESSILAGGDSVTLASLCPPNMRPLTGLTTILGNGSTFSRNTLRSRSHPTNHGQRGRKAIDMDLYGMGAGAGLDLGTGVEGADGDGDDDEVVVDDGANARPKGKIAFAVSPNDDTQSAASVDSAMVKSGFGSTASSVSGKQKDERLTPVRDRKASTMLSKSAKIQQAKAKRMLQVAAPSPKVEAVNKTLLAKRVMRLPSPNDKDVDPDADRSDKGEGVAESAKEGAEGGKEEGDDELRMLEENSTPESMSLSNNDADCRVMASYEVNTVDGIILRVFVNPSVLQRDETDGDSLDDDMNEDDATVVVGERWVAATFAKDIVSADLEAMEIIRLFTMDLERSLDVLAIRGVLMQIFRQADDEEIGELIADKFKGALFRFDVKLTRVLQKLTLKELSSVISEADAGEGTDDGMVNYEEFVAFSADLLLTLRARDQGKLMTLKTDAVIDSSILSIMHKQDLGKITNACQKQFGQLDHSRSGCLKLLDVRPILFGTTSMGLTDVEIIRIVREMPRDAQGHAQYTNFKAILEEVRFNTLKQAMVELRGTKLQRALLDECKVAEERYEDPKSSGMPKSSQFVHTGFLSLRHTIGVLEESSHIILTRMQVMVFISETDISADSKIDYYKLIPPLCNAVEILADKENGPQRDRIVETAAADFETTTVYHSFSKRQLKDIAKKLLLLVRLRLNEKGGVEISLPRDDLVLLATRTMQMPKTGPAPPLRSRKSTKTWDNDADDMVMLDKNKAGSVLQILHSSYTPSDIILRIVDEADGGKTVNERTIPIHSTRMELYKLSGAITENLTGIKKLLTVTDDPNALLDLGKMKILLLNMFHEVDDDNNGYLTFDEFQELLHQMDLGVPHNEMRMLIDESDENQDGVIQFNEFVPLAVDMIMTFTARRRAIAMSVEQDSIAQFSVYNQMQVQEIDLTIQICMEKFAARADVSVTVLSEMDKSIIKPSHFKAVLVEVGAEMGISYVEINKLCHSMPHNSFGKIIFHDFPTIFERMRFNLLKQKYYEKQGGLLAIFLQDCYTLEEHQYELARPKQGGKASGFVPTGCLDFADLRKMLLRSSTVSLGKLQVVVIVSCFDLNPDGKVDYVKYAPLAVNIIRMLNNPAALRQKAEIIESQDLSIASLVEGTKDPETFEHKLLTLFRTYDTNHNNSIDRKEFLICLQSLGFGKTEQELRLIADMAKNLNCFEARKGGGGGGDGGDDGSNGFDTISFDGFKKFFWVHLLDLSNKNEIKEMKKYMTSTVTIMTDTETKEYEEGAFDIADLVLDADEEANLAERLASLFRMVQSQSSSRNSISNSAHGSHGCHSGRVERDHPSGFVTLEDVEQVLYSLELTLSVIEMKMVLAEVEVDSDSGLVDFYEFLPVGAKLLATLKASRRALASEHRKEVMAHDKALKMAQATMHEIDLTVKYIHDKVGAIERSTIDHKERLLKVHHAVLDHRSGLTANEAKQVNRKFFPIPGRSRDAHSEPLFKIEHHEHQATSLMELDPTASLILSPASSPTATSATAAPFGPDPSTTVNSSSSSSDRRPRTSVNGSDPTPPHTPPRSRRGSTVPAETHHRHSLTGSEHYRNSLAGSEHRRSSLGGALGGGVGGSVLEALEGPSKGLTTSSKSKDHKDSNSNHRSSSTIRIGTGPGTHIITTRTHVSFAEEDLRKFILEIRSANNLRGLLEQSVHGPAHNTLLSCFTKAAERYASEGPLPPIPPGFLPVLTIIDILEHDPRLRTSRTLTMGMISMSDCYDPSGKLIHYARFAEYASEVLTIMRSDEGVDCHIQAIKSVRQASTRTLSTKTGPENMMMYFARAFGEESEAGEKYVTREKIMRVLEDLPGFDLTLQERMTILAIAKHNADGLYEWADITTWAHGTIHSLVRVRMVLHQGTSAMEQQSKSKKRRDVQMKELVDMSKKLLNLVRLMLDDKTRLLSLTLPWELDFSTKKTTDYDIANEFDLLDATLTSSVAPGFDAETLVLVKRVLCLPLQVRAIPQRVLRTARNNQMHGSKTGTMMLLSGVGSGKFTTGMSQPQHHSSHQPSSQQQLQQQQQQHLSMSHHHLGGHTTPSVNMNLSAKDGSQQVANMATAAAAAVATAALMGSSGSRKGSGGRSMSVMLPSNTPSPFADNPQKRMSAPGKHLVPSLPHSRSADDEEEDKDVWLGQNVMERALTGVQMSEIPGQVAEAHPVMVCLSISLVEGSGAPSTPTRRVSHLSNSRETTATLHAASAEVEVHVTADSHQLPGPGGMTQYAVPKDLIAKVVCVDSCFHSSMVIPVKLPTVAMIDKEAAEEFAANLCTKFYLEVPHDWESGAPVELHMYDLGANLAGWSVLT